MVSKKERKFLCIYVIKASFSVSALWLLFGISSCFGDSSPSSCNKLTSWFFCFSTVVSVTGFKDSFSSAIFKSFQCMLYHHLRDVACGFVKNSLMQKKSYLSAKRYYTNNSFRFILRMLRTLYFTSSGTMINSFAIRTTNAITCTLTPCVSWTPRAPEGKLLSMSWNTLKEYYRGNQKAEAQLNMTQTI